MKKISPKLSYLIIGLLIGVFSLGIVLVVQAGEEHNLRGWLWSGTDDGNMAGQGTITTGVGWISINSLSGGGAVNYGVNIPDSDGSVTGYAWSENIGWIDFSGVQREGDNLTGWARFLSIKDAASLNNSGNWQGWIKLQGAAQDGSSYGVKINSDFTLSGYAWSDELGWIDFSRSNYAPKPQCSFYADPSTIISPQTATLFWQCEYAESCSISPDIGSVNNASGSQPVSPSTTTTYVLTCSNSNGSADWTAQITVLKSKIKEIAPE